MHVLRLQLEVKVYIRYYNTKLPYLSHTHSAFSSASPPAFLPYYSPTVRLLNKGGLMDILTGDTDPSWGFLISSLGTVKTRRRDRMGKLYIFMKGVKSPAFQPPVLCMSSRLLMLMCDCSSSSTTAWPLLDLLAVSDGRPEC